MLILKHGLSYLLLTSIIASANGVHAQSITTGANGLNTNVDQVGNQYNITGGTQAGGNLFYSLQKLGLSTGEIANFLSNPNVQNVLTRVTGGEASLINGLIQVTGGNSNLFIMNPAGIVFGANASLNVPASFSATTASGIQVGNGWFGINSSVDEVRNLTGNITGYAFTNTLPSVAPNSSGVIINEGNLNVSNGKSVTLVGGMVVNTGTIATPSGNITIAATPDNKFIKITSEGSLLSLELPIADQQVVGNAPVLRGVDLPSLLIGKTAGTAIVSGNLDVSGNNGGNVQVLGSNVTLASANINANGINGGGTVLVGGDLLGTGTTPTAQSTTVDANSKINADALTNGNGGKVIVWADNTTKFDGTITAKAGTQSGNGGLVETSGKNTLIVGNTAQVNTSAPQGLSGNWLLDPTSITVVAAGGIDPDLTAVNANTGASTVDSSVIVTALGVGNVTLTAANFITVDAAINSASGNGLVLNAPTTNLNAPITLTGTLTGNATTVNVGVAGIVQNGVDAAASGATVNLAATTYTLGATVPINKNLTVNGAGANNTIVSGNNAVRVFNIRNNSTVNINDLSVTNGRSTSDAAGADIESGSTLNLNRTIFSNNSGSLGSAISNGGILNIDNSIFSNNSAPAGSGITNFNATATISNSTFSNNSANILGVIYSQNSTTTISNSTFTGNTLANRAGAAIFNEGGTTNISNSTFSGNSTTNGRGIIFNFSGTTNISNITVFGNTPNPQGAIFNENGTTNISNSIIVGNSSVGNPEINRTGGTINFSGANIVGENATSGINGTTTGVTPITPTGAASTVINTTLANNGGSTQTFALSPNSIALDASTTAGGAIPTTSDQRGILTVNGTRDIGAFESRGFTLTPVGGTTPQSATVNTLFGNLLGVTVSFDGGVVDGETVTFTAPNTAASGLFGASSTTTVTITGGIATAGAFRATTTSGTYNVTATATGVSNTANFALTNTPDAPATITATGGTPQSAVVNTAFANQLQVSVTDQFGNVVPNSTVTFTSPNAGASTSVVSTTATTNASGVATVSVTANTIAGTYTNTATSGAATPANFTLTNNPDAPATITATGGTPQSTVVNTAFANQLQVSVTDQFGNVVPNSTVTFTAPNAGASTAVAIATATTNASGVATVSVTANTIAGSYTNTATSGTATAANFTLTNTPDVPATITATGGTPQSTVVNTAFANQLQVSVTDQFGNVVPNSTVTFTAPNAGASTAVAIATATTNASGVATVSVTANTIAGTYTNTATSGAATAANFTLTNTPDAPATITATGGTPQSTVVNTAFANQLQVSVTDQFGNVVPNSTVTFTSPNAGASTSVVSTTATTNASGVATVSVNANTIAGSYTNTATSGAATPANFALTNIPVAVPPVVVPPVVVPPVVVPPVVTPPVVTTKPDIDPNKETRRHDEKKVVVLSPLTPIAFLSTDDIEFQRLDRFLIVIVELMNKDGGNLAIDAKDIWKDADINIINESSNQDVIKLAIRRSIGRFIGNEYIELVDVNFETKKDKKNILLKVRKSPRPAKFLKN